MKNLIYPVEHIADMLMNEKKIKEMSPEDISDSSIIQKYITEKKLFSNICDCLDFLNFSVIVTVRGKDIVSIESIFSIEDTSRYINTLTNNIDNFLIKTAYSHRFHSKNLCEDNADYRMLLEHKIENMKKHKAILLNDFIENVSYSDVTKTTAELFEIMKKLGIDRKNIIDSTYKAASELQKSGKTYVLFSAEQIT